MEMKKLITLCLVFAVTVSAMLFAVPAYAEDATLSAKGSLTLNATKKQATWSLTVDATEAGKCISGVVFYAGRGELLSTNFKTYNVSEGENKFNGTYTIPAGTETAKMVTWDTATHTILGNVTEQKLSIGKDPFEGDDEVNIVFIGDSLFANAGATAANGRTREQNGFVYQVGEWMKEKYAAPGRAINWYNMHAGGTTTDYTLLRLKRDVIDKNPDIVFLGISCNDKDSRTSDTVRNIESCIRTINEMTTNRPYVVLMMLTNATGGNITYNMEKIAEHYELPYFSDHAARQAKVDSGISPDTLYNSDGVHPTNEGYEMIADALIKWLGNKQNFVRPAKKAEKLNEKSGAIATMEVFNAADESRVTRNKEGRWQVDNVYNPKYLKSYMEGARLEFDFTGDILGFETALNKYVRSIDVYIDGRVLWNCNSAYNMNDYQMTVREGNFNFDLPYGDHHVVLELYDAKNEAPNGMNTTHIYNIFAGSWK